MRQPVSGRRGFSARSRRRGLTLIELLTVAAMSGIIILALSLALAAALRFEREAPRIVDDFERRMHVESQIRSLLRLAYITADEEDEFTYFIGGSSGLGLGSIGAEAGADEITFTIAGSRIPPGYLTAAEEDLGTLNRDFGPVGGVAEISLSTSPYAYAPVQEGLFLREQRPADGDPTQGGFQSLLSAEVQTISFEFFDGLNWSGSWDTTTGLERRLPAAVRVSYTLRDEEEGLVRVFVVRLPNSDVTADNPLGQGGTLPGGQQP
jgi:hypothetical protein